MARALLYYVFAFLCVGALLAITSVRLHREWSDAVLVALLVWIGSTGALFTRGQS
jgi:hypothetical protein